MPEFSKFYVLFFLFIFISVAAFAESCNQPTTTQYRPNGACSTSSRVCCSNGSWSEWDGSCPAMPTPRELSSSAVISCMSNGSKYVEACGSVSTYYKFESDDYYTDCANLSGTVNWYKISGFRASELRKVKAAQCDSLITHTMCPGGTSQQICNSYGRGYKCIKSYSGSCGAEYDVYVCDGDCSNTSGEDDEECYDNGSYESTEYLEVSGSAIYLICE